jgi:hypothetical protein
MNEHKDLQVALRGWLHEDTGDAVGGVLDTVLGQLDAHPQRRRWAFLPGGLTGRRLGARALVFAVGLLVLAMVAMSLLSVASPRLVSESEAPSSEPTADASQTDPPSASPAMSTDPSLEPSPSVAPSAQPSSAEPTPEPTFDWASTKYRVVFDSSVYEGDTMSVFIFDAPDEADCTIKVVYADGSLAITGGEFHHLVDERAWGWNVPLTNARGLATVDTTCTYQGHIARDSGTFMVEALPPPFTPAPGWSLVGNVDSLRVSAGETLTFTGHVDFIPAGDPFDLDCTFTLKWPDGDQSTNAPHVTTVEFQLSLVIGDNPPLGGHLFETTCVDAAGAIDMSWGTFWV